MNIQIQAVLSQSRRICIVKPDALGDFLLALPALCALRKRYPDARITLLTSPVVYSLATCFDVVDVLLPVPLFSKQTVTAQDVHMAAQAVLTLCDGGFDATVLLRWDVDYYAAAPLVYALNSPARISYSAACSPRKTERTPAFDSFFTHALIDDKNGHEVLKNSALLGLEPPEPHWQPASAALRVSVSKQSRMAENFLVKEHYIAVGISASMARKKLSLQNMCDVLTALAQATAKPLVVFGGAEDKDFAQQLCARTGALNYCGQLSFDATLLALRSALGMVTVDSFSKHAAALVGVPVVELSCQSAKGDPNAEYGGVRFGAWGVAARLVKPAMPAEGCPVDGCVHNESHCTNGIEVRAVVAACVELFSPVGN